MASIACSPAPMSRSGSRIRSHREPPVSLSGPFIVRPVATSLLMAGRPRLQTSAGDDTVSFQGISGARYQLPIDFSYEADVWGRVRRNVAASVATAQATSADVQTALLSSRAELAVDYFTLRALDTQTALLQTTIAAYERADRRRHGGILPDTGVDGERWAGELQAVDAVGVAEPVLGDRAFARPDCLEITAADVRTRRMTASVLLIKALGGGWTTADLRPVPP